MSQLWTVIEEGDDALAHVSAGSGQEVRKTYVQSQVDAVAKVDSLEATAWVVFQGTTLAGQSEDTLISNIGALHKPDSSQFWKGG